jgi:hypothetical protein
MSDSLRDQVVARLVQHQEAGLQRATIDVAGEQVTLWARGEQLHELCTCGFDGCEHVGAALRFLGGGHTLALPLETRARSSSSRPPATHDDFDALAAAFEDLCLATARAGVVSADSPSIKRALTELLNAAPTPTPLPLARWVGRLQEALATREVGEVAQLFDGALRWADELRARDMSSAALARRRAWLGSRDGLGSESLGDVTLLEVAREWVAGTERAQIERRYLLDLSGGEVLVEERRRGDLDVSVGPCPRLAVVAFAELATASRPPRARLLQYAISVQVNEHALARVVEVAHSEVSALRERYVSDLRSAPGLSEPFAIFAPAVLESGGQASLRDRAGERIEFAEPDVLPDAVRAASAGGELVCVLGRLLGRASGLALKPLSAIVRRGAWLELSRIT